MKRTLLFTLFFLAAPVLLAARVLQQFYMLDAATGFYKDDFGYIGNVISVVCVLLIPALVLVVWLSRPGEIMPNNKSKGLGAASFVAAFCLAISGVTHVINAAHVGHYILALMSVGTAAVIMLQGISCFTDGKFNGGLSIISILYGLARLIITFMGYTGEVTVTDTVFDIATMCLLLLFLYSSGKIMSEVSGSRTPVLYFACGLSAAFFCVDSVLAPAIAKLLNFNIHGSNFDVANIGFAVYIVVMLYVTSGKKAAAPAKEEEANAPDSIPTSKN